MGFFTTSPFPSRRIVAMHNAQGPIRASDTRHVVHRVRHAVPMRLSLSCMPQHTIEYGSSSTRSRRLQPATAGAPWALPLQQRPSALRPDQRRASTSPAACRSHLSSSAPGSWGSCSSLRSSTCSPSRQDAQPTRAAAVRSPVRPVFPSYCGQLAAALALPSRPRRRRGLVHRLHHTVALEQASNAWHSCSIAPGKPMAGERRAPFLP